MGAVVYSDMIEDIAAQGAEGPIWFAHEASERFTAFCAEQGELWRDRDGVPTLMLVCAHVAAELVRRTRKIDDEPLSLGIDEVLALGLWREGVPLNPLPRRAHYALTGWWKRLAVAVSATRQRPPLEQIQQSIAAAIALAIELTVAEPAMLDAEYGFGETSS